MNQRQAYQISTWTAVASRQIEKKASSVHPSCRRLGNRVPCLITTDKYPTYEEAILKTYGQTSRPPRTGKPDRPKTHSTNVAPEALHYAVVRKTRDKGRVIKVSVCVIFGVLAAMMEAMAAPRGNRAINTAFIERHNGTDRLHGLGDA